MRRRTHEECAELRSEAEAAALATRQAADEYAKKVREKAEDDARRTVMRPAQGLGRRSRRAIADGCRSRSSSPT